MHIATPNLMSQSGPCLVPTHQKAAVFELAAPTAPRHGRFVVALVLLLQWGIPLNFVGIPPWMSIQVFSAIFFVISSWRIARSSKFGPLDGWEKGILAFIGYCYSVTVISNLLIFHYAFSEWASALTYIFPLLFILVAKVLNIRAGDILTGLIIATTICAALIVIDRISPLSAFDEMVSRSNLSDTGRRIVLMHNESAFAIVVLVGSLSSAKGFRSFMVRLLPLAMISFSLVVVAESRLAVGATSVGVLFFFFFIFRSRFKIPLFFLGIIMVVVIAPLVLDKYIDSLSKIGVFGQLDELTDAEDSTRFRITEMKHFQQYFDKTDGLGFGLMTVSPFKTNFIARSMISLSALYDVDYQMTLLDIRIYAALYQFGYIGLIGVLLLTYLVVTRTMGIGRRRIHPNSQMIGAVGCIALGYMISPIPANLFTADNTVLIGGLIYALTGIALHEEATIAKATRPNQLGNA